MKTSVAVDKAAIELCRTVAIGCPPEPDARGRPLVPTAAAAYRFAFRVGLAHLEKVLRDEVEPVSPEVAEWRARFRRAAAELEVPHGE